VLPLLFPTSGLNLGGYLAIAGRYLCWLLAFMVLISSAVGAARRRSEGRRFDSAVRLEELTWAQFEGYLAEYFRRRGCVVTSRGGSLADGGVDLVLEDGSGRRIVQAKHWKTRRVGVVPLRALWGVLEDERAQGAICVTSGEFTPDARAFARGKALELIEGIQLRQLIAQIKGEPARAVAETSVNTCPRCGRGVLQRKLARRGRNAGSYFLGCNRYPECKYASNI
jgi:restriction system protein